MLGKSLKERRVAWARRERSIHYTPSAASRFLSRLSSISLCLYLSFVIVARAREYGTQSFIMACVTNRLSPATDIGKSLDIKTALFVFVMFQRDITNHLTETHLRMYEQMLN